MAKDTSFDITAEPQFPESRGLTDDSFLMERFNKEVEKLTQSSRNIGDLSESLNSLVNGFKNLTREFSAVQQVARQMSETLRDSYSKAIQRVSGDSSSGVGRLTPGPSPSSQPGVITPVPQGVSGGVVSSPSSASQTARTASSVVAGVATASVVTAVARALQSSPSGIRELQESISRRRDLSPRSVTTPSQAPTRPGSQPAPFDTVEGGGEPRMPGTPIPFVLGSRTKATRQAAERRERKKLERLAKEQNDSLKERYGEVESETPVTPPTPVPPSPEGKGGGGGKDESDITLQKVEEKPTPDIALEAPVPVPEAAEVPQPVQPAQKQGRRKRARKKPQSEVVPEDVLTPLEPSEGLTDVPGPMPLTPVTHPTEPTPNLPLATFERKENLKDLIGEISQIPLPSFSNIPLREINPFRDRDRDRDRDREEGVERSERERRAGGRELTPFSREDVSRVRRPDERELQGQQGEGDKAEKEDIRSLDIPVWSIPLAPEAPLALLTPVTLPSPTTTRLVTGERGEMEERGEREKRDLVTPESRYEPLPPPSVEPTEPSPPTQTPVREVRETPPVPPLPPEPPPFAREEPEPYERPEIPKPLKYDEGGKVLNVTGKFVKPDADIGRGLIQKHQELMEEYTLSILSIQEAEEREKREYEEALKEHTAGVEEWRKEVERLTEEAKNLEAEFDLPEPESEPVAVAEVGGQGQDPEIDLPEPEFEPEPAVRGVPAEVPSTPVPTATATETPEAVPEVREVHPPTATPVATEVLKPEDIKDPPTSFQTVTPKEAGVTLPPIPPVPTPSIAPTEIPEQSKQIIKDKGDIKYPSRQIRKIFPIYPNYPTIQGNVGGTQKIPVPLTPQTQNIAPVQPVPTVVPQQPIAPSPTVVTSPVVASTSVPTQAPIVPSIPTQTPTVASIPITPATPVPTVPTLPTTTTTPVVTSTAASGGGAVIPPIAPPTVPPSGGNPLPGGIPPTGSSPSGGGKNRRNIKASMTAAFQQMHDRLKAERAQNDPIRSAYNAVIEENLRRSQGGGEPMGYFRDQENFNEERDYSVLLEERSKSRARQFNAEQTPGFQETTDRERFRGRGQDADTERARRRVTEGVKSSGPEFRESVRSEVSNEEERKTSLLRDQIVELEERHRYLTSPEGARNLGEQASLMELQLRRLKALVEIENGRAIDTVRTDPQYRETLTSESQKRSEKKTRELTDTADRTIADMGTAQTPEGRERLRENARQGIRERYGRAAVGVEEGRAIDKVREENKKGHEASLDVETVKGQEDINRTIREQILSLQSRNRYLSSSSGREALREEARLSQQLTKEQRANRYKELAAEIGPFSARLKILNEDLQSTASLGSTVFAGGTAGILAMVSAANPVAFNTFRASVEGVAISIGGMFGSSVVEVSGYLQRFADYVDSLDPATKNLIVNVTGIGIGLGGLAMILPRAITLLGYLKTGFIALAYNPFTYIITGTALLLHALGLLEPAISGIKDVFVSMADVAGRALGGVAEVAGGVAGDVGRGLGLMGGNDPRQRRQGRGLTQNETEQLPREVRNQLVQVGNDPAKVRAVLTQWQEENARRMQSQRSNVAGGIGDVIKENEIIRRLYPQAQSGYVRRKEQMGEGTPGGRIAEEMVEGPLSYFMRSGLPGFLGLNKILGQAGENRRQFLDNAPVASASEAIQQNRQMIAGILGRDPNKDELNRILSRLAQSVLIPGDRDRLAGRGIPSPQLRPEEMRLREAERQQGVVQKLLGVIGLGAKEGEGPNAGIRLSTKGLFPQPQMYTDFAKFGEQLTLKTLERPGDQDIKNELQKINNSLVTLGQQTQVLVDNTGWSQYMRLFTPGKTR